MGLVKGVKELQLHPSSHSCVEWVRARDWKLNFSSRPQNVGAHAQQQVHVQGIIGITLLT